MNDLTGNNSSVIQFKMDEFRFDGVFRLAVFWGFLLLLFCLGFDWDFRFVTDGLVGEMAAAGRCRHWAGAPLSFA